ncbi:receptor-type guanylate cyclase Gyc76C [Thrips palmi]|uniref:Guanylate cyclase n=1 Tax=Thrips palmi TaxID=161013 RepID=A0A6P8ZGH3_THRPL|nr:receptor-type guanylate cyclase Gyc76C [Thrips palmi]
MTGPGAVALSALLALVHVGILAVGEHLLVGYLTGSDRRPYDHRYHRPGLAISGAIALARDELVAPDGLLGSRGHSLDFLVSETYGEEVTSILETAALWTRNVSAFIGPQETCVHEAKLAAAFNLPMISYYCTNYETSDKKEYPTFARTRPADTQISKSVAAVCREFNWTHVSFVSQADHVTDHVAEAILRALAAAGVHVAARSAWQDAYHHGYSENPFLDIVRDTHRDTRIYIILGGQDDHIGFLAAMESLHLFDNGEYWVVGVDAEEYSSDHAERYLRGLLRDATVRLQEELWWPAGQPPVAEPVCGFRGERCIRHTGEIAGGVAGSLLLLTLIAGLVVYRNWRYEQELDSLLWKVDFREIKMADASTPGANGAANGVANGHVQLNGQAERVKDKQADAPDGHQNHSPQPPLRTSQVSLSSNPDADFRYSCIYTTVGVYRGRVLAVKKLGKTSIDITRAVKKELKLMRDLRHDNLNAFIGACVDPPNVCIVTEYCTRGSLKDILENEDVKLDNMFIASLVGDILRGMIFLHDSPLRFHGNLKSSNCLVDSRWVVKVADFGLHELKRGADDAGGATLLQQLQLHHLHRANNNHDQDTPCKCDGLLYRAPELLRAALAAPRGSQKGDVFAFGVVLYEIQGRHGPYGDCALAVDEVLRRVLHPEPGQPPYRPPLDSLENSFDFVRECLQECWAEDPELRPDLKAVRARLRPLRKGMKPNIFDNMIAMMEKYANNLEVLVDERTDQLQQEKRKTEALLYEMLPRCVADQLKRGQKVQAESFDSVTIYFSDIVGFTAMSAQSTPLQVVDFLNDLYTCFDSTIGHFDVYKVETIGDAYMVVSGLPVRNGDAHAAEVASMSLQLLEAVKTFRIRHRPGDALQLRIGIHSGPVCAGVVGLKMPRYCLFGDTVNTASRMESNGLPLRIHCSAECAALLQRIGGYELADRGLVRIKGKGDVRTYWLLGESEERRAARQGRKGSPGRVFVGAGSPGGAEGGDGGMLSVIVDPSHLSASCPAIDHLQLPAPLLCPPTPQQQLSAQRHELFQNVVREVIVLLSYEYVSKPVITFPCENYPRVLFRPDSGEN